MGKSKYVVTITRQFGSMGRPIAKKMAEKLGIEYYDRDIVDQAWAYPFLGSIFLYRNGLQGLGYGLVPMLGGVFELVARSAIVMFVAGKTSFAGVCLADPAAWIAALIPLIPYYIYVMRKWKKNEKQTLRFEK